MMGMTASKGERNFGLARFSWQWLDVDSIEADYSIKFDSIAEILFF
jgi:hypothetical protein